MASSLPTRNDGSVGNIGFIGAINPARGLSHKGPNVYRSANFRCSAIPDMTAISQSARPGSNSNGGRCALKFTLFIAVFS